MGLEIDGYVLRPARSAPANATTTGEAVSGVDRCHVPLADPSAFNYFLPVHQRPVAPFADMYRAAVLLRPESGKEEYLLWSANTSNFSLISEDTALGTWDVSGDPGFCSPLPGSLSVVNLLDPSITYEDGSGSLLIQDEFQRSLHAIDAVVVQRGDSPLPVGFGPKSTLFNPDGGNVLTGIDDQNPATGVVTFSSDALSTGLGGGFSVERGDRIIAVYYRVSPPTFWWTRNDPYLNRFGWNGKVGRWEPLKGSLPRNLGKLKSDGSYQLFPRPTRFEAGDSLPVGATQDTYSLIRVGMDFNAVAHNPEVLVVADAVISAGPDWAALGVDAVVGQKNGIMIFSPDYIALRAGLDVWYSPEQFTPSNDGDLGSLRDMATTEAALAPVPGPTDRPLVRFGSRQYLTPAAYDADSDLPASAAVAQGEVAWSRTTGRLVFSQADIDRATPGASTASGDAADYELPYLGARVYYDGIAMNTQPVPIKAPVVCVKEDGTELTGDTVATGIPASGKVFLPLSRPFPLPGGSGVSWVPDGSGTIPNYTAPLQPDTRPNGSALVRQVDGHGDSFFFCGKQAWENTKVVEYAADLSPLHVTVPFKRAEVARQWSTSAPASAVSASEVQIKRSVFIGQSFYFIQAEVTPCTYSNEPVVWTRVREPFIFPDGDEGIRFALNDSITVDWINDMGVGPQTADKVRDSLDHAIQAAGGVPVTDYEVGVERGRVYIKAQSTIEISWLNTKLTVDDLRGHAALGLLPGWRLSAAHDQLWLPDNGMSFGLHRSPENFSRKNNNPDNRSVWRFGGETGKILTENIPATPFYNVMNHPLVDLPGFDVDVHFRRTEGLFVRDLRNYDGIYYEFQEDRIQWVDVAEQSATRILAPADNLPLAAQYALPDTISSAAMEPVDSGYGLYLKQPSQGFEELVWKEDFLLPGNGGPGLAPLVSVVGVQIASGGAGQFTVASPAFSDNNISNWHDPVQVPEGPPEPGFLLHILTGDAEGIYTITAVDTPTGSLVVTPGFPASAGPLTPSHSYAEWRIYEGQTRDVYDPAVVADVVLDPFNHLLNEPFEIKVLSAIGEVVANEPDYTAVVGKARENNRLVWVRAGLDFSPSTQDQIQYITTGIEIGVIAESGLRVPDTSDPFFLAEDFSIRVEGRAYTTDYPASGDGLLTIGAPLPTPIAGDTVNVVPVIGDIQFGEDTLADNAAAVVYYDQALPEYAPANTALANPSTGALVLSQAATLAWSGDTLYFVEQMVTEGSLDVRMNPIGGSIFFNSPLREGQIVEAHYFQSDMAGVRKEDEDGNYVEVTEKLPLYVQLEECTRVDDSTFTFNPTGRTIADTVDPMVWAGVELQNFGGAVTCTIDNATATIAFQSPVDAADSVRINYGVYEAFGGEMAYDTSLRPVWRPPFMIDKDQSDFTLEGDRRDTLQTGQLMILGPSPFYITGTSYDPQLDVTVVGIWPPTSTAVGTYAPGKDLPTLLTADPVAVVIDPAGAAIPGGGYTGFMMSVDAEYAPADKFATQLIFKGDLRTYTATRHLMELGGYPLLIDNSTLSEDGRYTLVSFATPLPKKMVFGVDAVRISVRPVYGPNPYEFKGISPFIRPEGFALFLLGSTDSSGNELPGKELVAGIHYMIDASTGGVSLMRPEQRALKGGERLLLQYTKQEVVHPVIEDDAVLAPSYKSKHLSMVVPSGENGILGSTFLAKYCFRNPDSFYASTLPVEEYLSEVQEIAVKKVVESGPQTGGPPEAFPGSPDIEKQGILGLRSEVQDLFDQDRGARVYLSFYNNIVVALEQIHENIDGRIIGDRDGKFRFFVGRGVRYALPGYEDEITGFLNPRLIWRDLIESWASGLGGAYYTEEDALYLPPTAFPLDPTSLVYPGKTGGIPPDPFGLMLFMELQKSRVKNDMDDVLMIRMKTAISFSLFPPFPKIELIAKFEKMWEKNRFSRLYPQRTKAFTRLLPGIGANSEANEPGVYGFARMEDVPGPNPGEVTAQVASTFGRSIGPIANPAIGTIEGIVSVVPNDRYPRARIWAYYPEGDPDLDDAISAAGLTGTTVGSATLVCTPLDFVDFPIDSNTGFPDFAQLATQLEGGLSDLSTGSLELSTPGFEAGQRLRFGIPTGEVFDLFDTSVTYPSLFGLTPPSPIKAPVFVAEVIGGAILILGKQDGTAIAGTSIQKSDEGDFEAKYGDTAFVGSALPMDEASAASDPPGIEDMALSSKAMSAYRMGFDLSVARLKSQYRDLSFPSSEDIFGFPLKEMMGQQPPKPLSCLESEVSFINTSETPLELPCLKGEARDDSGDVQIPYLSTTVTELSALYEVWQSIEFFAEAEAPPGTYPIPAATWMGQVPNQYWGAVYPDEFLISDGSIGEWSDGALGPPNYAGSLYSDTDWMPWTGTTPYVQGTLTGSLRPYDLVFVECPDDGGAGDPQESSGLPAGGQGIITVGAVRGAANLVGSNPYFEPPRFVTASRPALTAPLAVPHRYMAENVFGFNTAWDVGAGAATSGCQVTEVFSAGVYLITFDVSSAWLGNPANRYVLDDGSDTPYPATTGGLQKLIVDSWATWAGLNTCVVTFYNPDPNFAGDPTICKLAFRNPSAFAAYGVWIPGAGALNLIMAGIGWNLDGSFKIMFESNASLLGATLGSPAGPLVNNNYYDFNISVDTYMTTQTSNYFNPPAAPGSNYGSRDAYIRGDRLTFQESLSFATALPVDSRPANNNPTVDMGLNLNVIETQMGKPGSQFASSVNEVQETNDNVRFKFRSRVGPDPNNIVSAGTTYVGTFVGAGVGVGRVRVMPFEWGNQSIVDQVVPATARIENILLSAAPSSDLSTDDPTGAGNYQICLGEGSFYDYEHDFTDAAYQGARSYILNTGASILAGSVGEVQSGDIVVVPGVWDSGTNRLFGCTRSGTYVVRYAFEPDNAAGTPSLRGLSKGVYAGQEGWLELPFPTVLKWDHDSAGSTFTITVKGALPSVYYSPTGHAFPASGQLYLVLKSAYSVLLPAGYEIDKDCVYKVQYTGVFTDADGNSEFHLQYGVLNPPENAQGDMLDPLSPTNSWDMFEDVLAVGQKLSGMQYLPIGSFGTYTDSHGVVRSLPDNNFQGAPADKHGANVCAGFRWISMRNTNNLPDPANVSPENTGRVVLWDSDLSEIVHTGAIVDTVLGVRVPVPVDPATFQADLKAPVLWRNEAADNEIEGVATYIDISHIQNNAVDPQWNEIQFDLTGALVVDPAAVYTYDHNLTCVLPGLFFWTGDDLADDGEDHKGFSGVAGLILEPSFPRTAKSLLQSFPHVVDADHTITDYENIGPRNSSDFTSAFMPSERASFFVRRIRRWHEIQDRVVADIDRLKLVYEIRRGAVSSYDAATRTYTADTSVWADGTATNVGDFNDPAVNIHPGDMLRVIDSDGSLLETVEIDRVLTSNSLILKYPGMSGGDAAPDIGSYFEVYLQQAPVPHEQSNEQLLEYLTDEVVYEREVVYNPADVNTTGGFVDRENTLRDSDVSGAGAWEALGVQKGDYLIIDPAGQDPLRRTSLYDPAEYAKRPMGDTSIEERLDGSWMQGGPAILDDNRGFYRVLGDEDSTTGRLQVDGTCRFAGGGDDSSSDVIFGSDPPANGYVVLPQVKGSIGEPGPVPGEEGQQMLRHTSYVEDPADPSFAKRPYDFPGGVYNRYNSIAPFGYKIIRPSPVFSDEAAELVLFMRERMLSWIEEIHEWWDNYRGGSYYVFQRDEHIDDLGTPGDTSDGVGLIYNALYKSLTGLTEYQPFASNQDCLSLLDRRFWIMDMRLDSEPTGGPDFYASFSTGEGRPVLPDLLDDVLSNDDDFRGIRYSWIQFRADWGDGSIQIADRAERRLGRKLVKEKILVKQKKALKNK